MPREPGSCAGQWQLRARRHDFGRDERLIAKRFPLIAERFPFSFLKPLGAAARIEPRSSTMKWLAHEKRCSALPCAHPARGSRGRVRGGAV